MTADWLKTYRTRAGRYDEVRDNAGQVRPHWQALLQHLSDAGTVSVQQGVDLARTLIAENGVTYNVYADPTGTDRPWALDALPLVLTADEWRGIEQGVQQRAMLLNAMLADLYGSQRMLSEGIVPPELVFGHPNFLWPCHGIKPLDDNWLPIYAVDLARAPNGGWWALSDRTQAPSGAGYALENRHITARVLPDVLRELRVRNVHGFYSSLREQLLRHAEDDSLAVVLTAGVFNETYFEHAYLARQLGLLLVQGHDLTVRNDTVYLKTLSGLRRVHAILRRLDDDYCDPVELRSDSALGVPGLLQAIRAQRVTVVNPLGSGVLDSAAWLGFLPGAAERLLGEKLLLPSVATWWCGERPALEFVLEHFDELVIKSVFPNQRRELVFGKELQGAPREELFERMRRRPHTFVAQERFALSQAPVWRTSGSLRLAARAVSLRVYAIATPLGYRVLPGGLARIAGETSADVVSNQQGGGSKDVWVLSAAENSSVVDQSEIKPGVVRASSRFVQRPFEVPSSLGENLFWMGRYTERCENKVRLLRASLAVRVEPALWESSLASCKQFGLYEEDVPLRNSIFAESRPNSLHADYKRLHWCATQVRGRLSSEHWRTVNVLRRQLRNAVTGDVELRETLDWLLLSLAAMSGFALDDMTQDDGWRLLNLGRRLERLQFLCDLLSGRLQSGLSLQQGELDWLLDVNSCTITYRSRHVAAPRLAPLLELFLRDASNPRTVAYQRDSIRHDLSMLSEAGGAPVPHILARPVASVLDMDFGVLEGAGQGASYARQMLAARMQDLSKAVGQLSDDLSLRYFSHVENVLQVVSA